MGPDPRKNPLPFFLAQTSNPHLCLLWVCFSWAVSGLYRSSSSSVLLVPVTPRPQCNLLFAVTAKMHSVPWQGVSCGCIRCCELQKLCSGCFRKPDPVWEHNMQECLRYKINFLDFLLGLSSKPICRTSRFATQMPSKEI